MSSQISIANAALDRIGQTPTTQAAIDLGSASSDPAAVVIARNFDEALEEFLAEAFWSWAKDHTTLTEESPAPTQGWTARFALPDNFVSVVGVNEIYPTTPSDIWEIESGFLFTDVVQSGDPATLFLEYIYKPTASSLETFLDGMDPKAVPALATLLASKIAPALAQDGLTMSTQLLQRYYGIELPKARMRNGQQNRPASKFPYQTSEVLRQRRSFSNR